MKPEDMMDTIGKLSDEHIEEFAQVRPRRFLIPWGMVATVAAFCVVIASAVWLRSAGILPGSTTEPVPTVSHPCTTLPLPTEQTTVPPALTTAPPDSTVPPTTGEKEKPFRPAGTQLQNCGLLAAYLESDTGWLNLAAKTGCFLTPESLDLTGLIRHSYDSAADLTAQETAFLKDAGFGKYLEGSIYRAPAAEVRQFLMEHFAITPEQLDISEYALLVYWEETDCYYACDAAVHQAFEAHSAYEQDNGFIHLYYNFKDKAGRTPEFVMVLQPVPDGYRLLSNWYCSETELANACAIQTVIPLIRETLPEGEGAVYDRYTLNTGWRVDGTQYEVSVRVPTLQPDSEGAIAINAQIRKDLNGNLDGMRIDCTRGYKPNYMSVDYESWMQGNICVVRIIRTDPDGNAYDKLYYLDTASGKALSQPQLAGMAYPEWLYRCCSMLKTHLGEDHRDGCGLFVSTSMDKDGNLWLSHQCMSPEPVQQELLFDPDAGELTQLADMYHWFFNIRTDGAFATQWSIHLGRAFFEDPALFVQALAGEDAETVERIASHTWFEMDYGDLPDYLERLESLQMITSDLRVVQTAQILKDSPAASSASNLEGVLRHRAAFEMVTDEASAIANSRLLYALCMESPKTFLNYMAHQDEQYYALYWKSVMAVAGREESRQIYETCVDTICDLNSGARRILAAQALLRLMQAG